MNTMLNSELASQSQKMWLETQIVDIGRFKHLTDLEQAYVKIMLSRSMSIDLFVDLVATLEMGEGLTYLKAYRNGKRNRNTVRDIEPQTEFRPW